MNAISLYLNNKMVVKEDRQVNYAIQFLQLICRGNPDENLLEFYRYQNFST